MAGQQPLYVGQPVQPETGAPQGANLPEPQNVHIQHVDRADRDEVFADSIINMFFDGQSLRLELGVTRLDSRQQNAPLLGRRYTACRLVLSPSAAVELINRAQQIGAAMAQAGVVKANPPDTANPR